MSDVTGSDPRRAAGNRGDKGTAKSNAAAKSQDTSSKIARSSKSPGDVGKALRSVYDTTLGERVPDDFLDLLGKLS